MIFYLHLKKKYDPLPMTKEETKKNESTIEISALVDIRKENLFHFTNPDQISEGNIDNVKLLAEQTWSRYEKCHQKQIKDKKSAYKIELITPDSPEQLALFTDLTTIKKNVLWVVLAANMAFYTIIITFSTFSEFFILGTNVLSFCLIIIFGLVQLIQTICMLLDAIKSLARLLSYI